jgi:hypothetical protein
LVHAHRIAQIFRRGRRAVPISVDSCRHEDSSAARAIHIPAIDRSQRANLSDHLSAAAQQSVLCQDSEVGPTAQAVRLGRIVCELNIGRFKHLLSTDIDTGKRQTVDRLLAEEQFYMKQLLAAGGACVAQKK